ncbi:MAG: dCMP deaminase family protein [Synergistaceae bacterium]|nr:dCMP deaminase family protein [Synergistaceae bacterium]
MTSDGGDAERPSWDAYFLAMAMIAATRSTCVRRRVGSVIVSDNRILATGYNGSPSGTPHCTDIGCLRSRLGVPSGQRHEICRGAHAEMNAVAQAASSGTSVNGCAVYVTHEPCSICSKILINAGCKRVVFMNPYPDELSRALRAEARLVSKLFENHGDVLKVLHSAML